MRELPAGTYFVCVNGPDGYSAAISDGGVWYRETCYGNMQSVEGAINVPLKVGEERSDIRIAVERERRYKVVVWPSGPEDDSVPNRYDVSLEGRNGASMKEANGSYVIPHVPAGHYTLQSTAWSEVQYVGAGDVDVDIVDADVTVHLRVGGLGEIGGVARLVPAPATMPSGNLISIESKEGALQRSLSMRKAASCSSAFFRDDMSSGCWQIRPR